MCVESSYVLKINNLKVNFRLATFKAIIRKVIPKHLLEGGERRKLICTLTHQLKLKREKKSDSVLITRFLDKTVLIL